MASKITLDVRHEACPSPMERILECLEKLERGEFLEVYHSTIPHMLFPILEKRSFSFEVSKQGDVVIYIWHKNDDQARDEVAALL